MNNIIKRVWNQNRMTSIEDLQGMAFQAEAGGHTFEISGIDDQGNAVPLSGTVTGSFIRPDQATVALTGTAEDGIVSVTLDEDCYAVAGRFGLTIFVTDADDQTVAVYAAVGTVSRSSTDEVAGSAPQDVVDLINAIEAAIATIPADYTDLMSAIAPTYSSLALYAVGSYAWRSGVLKQCIYPITEGESYNSAHWVNAVMGTDLSNLIDEFLGSVGEHPNADEWINGRFNGSSGGSASSAANVRINGTTSTGPFLGIKTSGYIDISDLSFIATVGPVYAAILAWDSTSTYVGQWNGSDFVKTSTALYVYKKIDVRNFPSSYKYKLFACDTSISTQAVIADTLKMVNLVKNASGFISENEIMIPAIDTRSLQNQRNASVLTNVLRTTPFYDHLFSDKLNGSNVIIPAESVFALAVSRRLGFKVTEINLNETSDGDYVVLHGSSGTFGAQVEHIDGVTDISSTAINTVTMSWIKQNVRFKSLYAKYRTAPSSLSEYLLECKKNGLVPMIQFRTDNSYVIANEIMGTDNYIAYNGDRAKTSAPIMYAKGTNPSSTADILAFCNQYGKPFWYCMTQPASFTDAQLTEIIETLHANGYQIGFAGNYTTEAEAQRCFDIGFDFSSSNHQVNDTVEGNLCNINGDLAFSSFETDGTASNGVLSLSTGDAIEPASVLDSVFLGAGVLYVRFVGTLHVKMGGFIDTDIVSDGSTIKMFSTYFLNESPTFKLTAAASTSVYSIEYRADKR